MALAAKLRLLPTGEKRQVQRERLRLEASLDANDSPAIDVVLHDISTHGFLAQSDAPLPIGARVLLELAGGDRLRARIRWHGSSTIGCEFDSPISREAVAAALRESPVVYPKFPAGGADQRPSAEINAGADMQHGLEWEPLELKKWPFWGQLTLAAIFSILLWALIIFAIRLIIIFAIRMI